MDGVVTTLRKHWKKIAAGACGVVLLVGIVALLWIDLIAKKAIETAGTSAWPSEKTSSITRCSEPVVTSTLACPEKGSGNWYPGC